MSWQGHWHGYGPWVGSRDAYGKESLRRPGTHPRVQATLRRMLADERGHLSWVKEWLDRQTGARRAAVPALMRRYSAVDAAIRKQLLDDYEWRELACAS